MVLALAAIAAAAASFPTGFGFGAGYGAGVRIGYDVIYPKLAPFASKITDDIIAQVSKLFGGNADIPAQSSGISGFAFPNQDDIQTPFPPESGGGRTGPLVELPTNVPGEGRRTGASELRETTKQAITKVTSPVTRVQLVYFKNYKSSTEEAVFLKKRQRQTTGPANTAISNKRSTALRLQTSSRLAISKNNWWPTYYNWLKTFR